MSRKERLLAILSLISCATAATISLKDSTGNVELSAETTSAGVNIVLKRNDKTKLQGTLGPDRDFTSIDCLGESACIVEDGSLQIEPIENGFDITWLANQTSTMYKDCFDLQVGDVNWYGGPERYVQKWPIEKLSLSGDTPYIIDKNDNFAVAERYWLNSNGAYIYLDEKVPLFIDQNGESTDGKVCFIAKTVAPYINRTRVLFNYKIVALDDPKEGHLHAINNYLGKPTGYPNEDMIAQPIWTTWANYKKLISDSVVIEFAKEIYDHGYTEGQIEIDDFWETCYGSQTFNNETFSKITETVQTLKDMGYRVTLWIHPFVNEDCEPNASEGKEKGYFVKNVEGSDVATWWDGLIAHQIDFTNPDAAEWFSARIRTLRDDIGIDSFKFDAGETNYGPQPSVYENVDAETVPNILTKSYIETVAQFGNLIEARSAWRTQSLPTFTRMIDKSSTWDETNGLYTLVTTLLQMNLNGYGLVLPDMIGGNGYEEKYPDAELIIRWTQANTFMPSMQFSYLPWDYPLENVSTKDIVKKFVDLHKEYAPDIITAMKNNVADGSPVNAPIWWVDPTDTIALATDDEYLLGENILVAPVIVQGATSRDVYLPKGTWQDGNTNETYEGPTTIGNYSAPIDTLPYFIKQ